ncbi:MAG TPA: WecB/TagA/CpsF family glycosyltransferase [Chitinivibrionales bacterium]|nr:WecB/TagA/CpsF family glycosyltransferase [Chitinivibrionales bacterium]
MSNIIDGVLGVSYFAGSFSDAMQTILSLASETGESKYSVFTPNVHHVYLIQKNEKLRQAYQSGSICLLDGMPLVWALRIFARKNVQKISGSDMFVCLFKEAIKRGMKVCLLGGTPGVAEKAASILLKAKEDKGLILTYSPPFGFEKSVLEDQKVINEINRFSPNILFVAFGAPKQEIWIYEHLSKLSVKMAMGVGGSFDFVAGVQKRAPIFMQNIGLEWLFRLICDPRRLWKRYLITNTFFIRLLITEAIKRMIFRKATNIQC